MSFTRGRIRVHSREEGCFSVSCFCGQLHPHSDSLAEHKVDNMGTCSIARCDAQGRVFIASRFLIAQEFTLAAYSFGKGSASTRLEPRLARMVSL